MTADLSGPEQAGRWRSLEAEALDLAQSMSDSTAGQAMLSVADGYRRLAERAEAVVRDPKRLIDGASFGPHALEAIHTAFDAAWAEIVGHFRGDGVSVRAARLRLAKALLSVASKDSREPEVLKQAALRTMALDYRRR